MTNKLKQNLRYQKADAKWRKKIYKGLNDDQKRMVKLTERYEQYEKDLNYFWQTAPRNNNNGVDWKQLTEEELNYFEYVNKQKEKTLKAINKLENKGISQYEAMKIFTEINIKSVCF